jgi:hypothetical protein
MCRRRFRLSRRPGVIHCAVAQLLHHLLKVRREVAVGGDAIGRGERHAVRLDRGPDRFRGVPRAKPCGPRSVRNRWARMRLGEYPIRRATTEVPPSPTHPTPQPTPFVAPYKLPGRGGSFASDCVVSGLGEMKSPHNHDPTGYLRRHRRWWFSVWTGFGTPSASMGWHMLHRSAGVSITLAA